MARLVCTQCAGKLDFNSVSGNAQLLQPGLTNVNLFTTSGNILFDGDFIRTGIYTMRSGKGTVEVHFSGNDSFDLNAQTATGTVDNQARGLSEARFAWHEAHGLEVYQGAVWHGRQRPGEGRTLFLQWYNPHIEA